MKRTVVNKAPEIECKWCNEMISSYNLTNHIKFSHIDKGTVNDYVIEHGEFRRNKLHKKKGIRNITKVQCEICLKEMSIIGMHNHLRDSHNGLTPNEYVGLGYTEYRPKQIDYKTRSKENDLTCPICERTDFASQRHFSYHVRVDHGYQIIDFVLKYFLNNEIPKCKCGCENEVGLLSYQPYFREFLSGHNSKGELNPMFGKKTYP